MRRLSDLAGMTAMEVVVAISLGLILTAVLTVVWVQSTRIYVETSEKLQVYESARRVLDIMDRDLSGCARTVTMEPESAAATAPPGRSFRAPWQPQDPLV